MKLQTKKILNAYLFLLIPLIYFCIVRFYPTILSFFISFTDWNIISEDWNFVGISNYIKIFKDSIFIKALGNTFKYVLYGVPSVIIISLLIAILLNNIKKSQSIYRLIYILPYITPLVAVSWVWRWLYQKPPIGIINNILINLGLPQQDFLYSPQQALISIVITTVWVNLGYCITIYLAGLQTIPKEYIEAAKIDGANGRQVFIKIIIPLLNPITLFLIVNQTISFLRIFTQIYNMSFQGTGGPLYSTISVVVYSYRKAFLSFEMGIASAATVILFVIIMIITFIQLKFLNKKIEY